MCSVGACSGRRCAGTENDKKKRQAAMTCPFSSNRFYGYGVPLPSADGRAYRPSYLTSSNSTSVTPPSFWLPPALFGVPCCVPASCAPCCAPPACCWAEYISWEAACHASFSRVVAESMLATLPAACAAFSSASALSMLAFLSAGILSPYSLSCFSVEKMPHSPCPPSRAPRGRGPRWLSPRRASAVSPVR